jgi:hypothetical protein
MELGDDAGPPTDSATNLPLYFADQAQLRIVAGIFGFGSTAVRFPERRTTAVMDPGRTFPGATNGCKRSELLAYSAARDCGTGPLSEYIYILRLVPDPLHPDETLTFTFMSRTAQHHHLSKSALSLLQSN